MTRTRYLDVFGKVGGCPDRVGHRYSAMMAARVHDSGTRNIRFWVSYNGSPVRVRLRPGDMLVIDEYNPHEEGYSHDYHTYKYRNGCIEHASQCGGKDCDGVLMHYCDEESTLANACAGFAPPWDWLDKLSQESLLAANVSWPLWGNIETRVFDQYAQAAGY